MPTQHAIVTYREPLRPLTKRALLASVIFFHVGAGYALTQIEPARLVVGDTAPMEVSFVSPPAPPQPQAPPPEPEPPPPELESMIEPPLPDLPPPTFPVEAPPPRPKPPPPKPRQQATPQAPPTAAPPQPAAPAPAAAPRVLNAAQVGWAIAPSPIYPLRARRAGNQGTATVKAYVDVTGRPTQVSLQASSGFPELDEQALSAVRAAHLRPVPEPTWVIAPITFKLQ